MIKKITIPYFPNGLKYVTPLLFGAGIYLIILSYPVFGGILIFAGTVISATIIDMTNLNS